MDSTDAKHFHHHRKEYLLDSMDVEDLWSIKGHPWDLSCLGLYRLKRRVFTEAKVYMMFTHSSEERRVDDCHLQKTNS